MAMTSLGSGLGQGRYGNVWRSMGAESLFGAVVCHFEMVENLEEVEARDKML